MVGVEAIVGVAYLILLGLAIWQLWQASRTGRDRDWQEFWWVHWFVWGAALFLLQVLLPGFMGSWTDQAQAIQALRQAIVDGDEGFAPRGAEQPALLERDELPTDPLEFGPFPSPSRIPVGRYVLPGMPLLLGRLFLPAILLGYAIGLGSLAVLNRHFIYEWLVGRPALEAAIATVLAVVAGLWIYALGLYLSTRPLTRLLRQGVRLVANDAGLQLSFVGQDRWQRHIPWQGVRAFCVVRLPPTMSIIQGTGYILGSSERALTWWITPATAPAVVADHKRLCRLIVTRTGLPLRDVSAVMADLARSPFRARVPTLEARIVGTMDQAALDGRRRKRTLIAVALAPVILTALLSTAGLVLQHM
jgi:hypothetical protein